MDTSLYLLARTLYSARGQTKTGLEIFSDLKENMKNRAAPCAVLFDFVYLVGYR
jgi:hypothetical protein